MFHIYYTFTEFGHRGECLQIQWFESSLRKANYTDNALKSTGLIGIYWPERLPC